MLVLITLGAALAVGYLRGGRLRLLLGLRLRRARLLLTALGIAVGGVLLGWTWSSAPAVAWSLAFLLAAWFCRLNRHVHGGDLVAAGLLFNAIGTLVALMSDPPGVLAATGDVIPVALPWMVERISAGDLLVAAGLATALATTMISSDTPGSAEASSDETLDDFDETSHDEPLRDQREEHNHGEAGAQAQGPEEERREPRQEAEHLSRHLA